MSRSQLVLATQNLHKVKEFQDLLGSHWRVFCPRDRNVSVTWDESADNFMDNATIKLNAVKQNWHARFPDEKTAFLADDSGLCVEALEGFPGVRSSSFGGIEGDHRRNVERLLKELEPYPTLEKRKAYFYCLLLYEDISGVRYSFEGRIDGLIALQSSGSGGFGYDPVFFLPDLGQTMATISSAEKNRRSHRSQAVLQFMSHVRKASL
jgi:XTP/dITP diphosphohydrolase